MFGSANDGLAPQTTEEFDSSTLFRHIVYGNPDCLLIRSQQADKSPQADM